MNTSYRSSARDYLKRAQRLLGEGNFESLFYAAFELRCGIEARMREYLEIAEDISEKKKLGWKIAELGNNLEKAFRLGDKIVELIFEDMASSKICRVYYTPVSSRLQQRAKGLGDYLHAMKQYRKPEDSWWKSFRLFLDQTCKELADATKGTLLGPPLMRADGKGIKTHIELEVNLATDEVMRAIALNKGNIKMRACYFDELPPALNLPNI
jgi:hypothetical protein